MIRMVFDAEGLKRRRESLGLTQDDLSSGMGISTSSLRPYELGYRKPSMENLEKMAKYLGIEGCELYRLEVDNKADIYWLLHEVDSI